MRTALGNSGWSGRFGVLALAGSLLAGAATPAPAETDKPFPEVKPATRVEAIAVLTGAPAQPVQCLTPRLQSLGAVAGATPAPVRRALELGDELEGLKDELRLARDQLERTSSAELDALQVRKKVQLRMSAAPTAPSRSR